MTISRNRDGDTNTVLAGELPLAETVSDAASRPGWTSLDRVGYVRLPQRMRFAKRGLMHPFEKSRRIEQHRVRRVMGRFLRGPDVTAHRAITDADDPRGAIPVLGDLTTDELARVVRLACFVTPRSDEEQLLLLKAAAEVDHATDSGLVEDVRSSVGFPQRDLEIPEVLATAAKVAAVGGMLAGVWRAARRLLAIRRRRVTSGS
jgi:hypothetical protein